MKPRRPPKLAPEGYLRLFRLPLRNTVARLRDEDPSVQSALLHLIAQVEGTHYVGGSLTALAEFAGVTRKTFAHVLLRWRARRVAVYDKRLSRLEFNPNIVFDGTDRARREAIRNFEEHYRGRVRLIRSTA